MITDHDIEKMVKLNNPGSRENARSWKEERKHMELVERGVLKDTSPGAVEARMRLSAYDNEVFEITIDLEFEALIPPPTDEERAALEAELLAHGCLDALKVWRQGNILLDGHNRIRICRMHGLEYAVEYLDFDSREDALLWMIDNQLGRRNLTGFQRSELALKKKPIVEEQARKRMLAGKTSDPGLNLDEGRTDKILATEAGVGKDTLRKVETIVESAPTPIVEKARSGDISVDRAYKLTRVLQDAPARVVELVTRLELDSADKVDILKRLHESSSAEGSNDTFGEVEKSGGFHYGDTLEQWCNFAVDGVETIHKALRSLAYTHALMNGQVRDAERDQNAGDKPDYKRDSKTSRAATPYVPQGNDACQTPAYAIDPLLPYLRTDQTIWEPACGEGLLVEAFYDAGFNSIEASDLIHGREFNFFDYEPPDWDVIVTNPPFTLKFQWMERCYQLGKPFALLLPVEALGAKTAQELMQQYGFEIMLLNRRVSFKMPYKGWNGAGAQFSSLWFCWHILPQQVMFGEITIKQSGDIQENLNADT